MVSKTLFIVLLGLAAVLAAPTSEPDQRSTFTDKIQGSLNSVKNTALKIRDSLANVGHSIAKWWDKTQHPEKYEYYEKLQKEYENIAKQYQLQVHSKMDDYKLALSEVEKLEKEFKNAQTLKDNLETEMSATTDEFQDKLKDLVQKIQKAANEIEAGKR